MNCRRVVLLVLTMFAAAGTAAAQESSPKVRIDGVVYAQYGYLFADVADDFNAFDVKRTYLNVRGDLGHGVTSRVTPDIYRVADGSLGFRLKYAYATWRPEHGSLGVTGGMMQTPWVDFEETMWGYRMQGTIALDRNGYLTSSDLGVGVDGAWNDDDVNFQMGVFNGEGYNKPEGDRRKDVAGRLSFRLAETDDNSRTGGLRLSGFGHYGTPTGGGARHRALGMLSYKSRMVTLAGEYAITRDRSDNPPAPAAPDAATTDGSIITAFGVLRVPRSPVSIIGRVDVADPDVNVGNNRETRVIGGVAYRLTPNVRLLVDVDHVSYEGGTPAAAEAARTQGLLQAELTF